MSSTNSTSQQTPDPSAGWNATPSYGSGATATNYAAPASVAPTPAAQQAPTPSGIAVTNPAPANPFADAGVGLPGSPTNPFSDPTQNPAYAGTGAPGSPTNPFSAPVQPAAPAAPVIATAGAGDTVQPSQQPAQIVQGYNAPAPGPDTFGSGGLASNNAEILQYQQAAQYQQQMAMRQRMMGLISNTPGLSQ